MATMTLDGRRCYIATAFGEPAVAPLKELGVHWDPDSRRWWISSAKKDQVAAILAAHQFDPRKALDRAAAADQAEEAGASPEAAAKLREAPREDISTCRIYAQVEYKGRRYYVIAETKDLSRCRLATLDGSLVFWADCSACNLLKRYEPREVWDGRRYSGTTRTEYQTIGSMRRFVEREKRNRADGGAVCAECGKSGELVRDLEDGLLKHRGCCDIEP